MSAKEVTQLRKSGRLDEALKLALADIRFKADEWSWSALFWTFRELAEREITQGKLQEAEKFVEEMEKVLAHMQDADQYATRALESMRQKLDPISKLVKLESERRKTDHKQAYHNMRQLYLEGKLTKSAYIEQYGWCIYSYLSKEFEQLGSVATRQLLLDYIKLNIPAEAHLLHSVFIQFAPKVAEQYPEFKLLPFIKMWGTDKFTAEDLQEQSKDGKTYPSLVDRLLRKLFASKQNSIDEVVAVFESVQRLTRQHITSIFQESYYWDICNATGHELFRLFEQYPKYLGQLSPSEAQSKIVNSAWWKMKEDNEWRFAPFFLHFKPADFRDVDFKPDTKEDGKTYDALVLKCISKGYDYVMKHAHQVDTQHFIALMRKQLQYAPDNAQLLRKLAILLSQTGQQEEAAPLFEKLLLQLNEWYVWSDVAKTISDNKLKMAYWAKALLMQHQDNFLGEVHLQMAECMLQEGLNEYASAELSAYRETRLQNNWKIEERYHALHKQVEGIEPHANNRSYYLTIAAQAEEDAYSRITPERMALIARYNNAEGKPRLKLSNADGSKSISLSANKFTQLRHIKPGQLLDIRMHGKEVLCASLIEAESWSLFPTQVGRIEYINQDKKVIHIVMPDGRTCFYSYENTKLQKDNFVRFIAVPEEVKGERRINPCKVHRIPKEEAIGAYPTAVVVVDHVNQEKSLFRVVLHRVGTGILHFRDTDLRPSVGDFLKIHYCTSTGKDGKPFIRILAAERTDEENPNLIRRISGRLNVKWKGQAINQPDFGFVDDFYVGKHLLQKHRIMNDCDVKATALYDGEKWQVAEVEVIG